MTSRAEFTRSLSGRFPMMAYMESTLGSVPSKYSVAKGYVSE